MPALSPTMTEGNIASWKVKEGDSFSAGDVLLEIETDKATMDVEAQEDGIMVKIVSQDGSKGVQVGTRIAVVADAGDDVSALELPPDEKPQQATQSPSSQPAAPASRQEEPKSAGQPAKRSDTAAGGTYEHSYPLLPSVGLLVHEHGISKEDVSKIKGTGPNGRLLKGDVLAFLGAINADRPATVSSHLTKLAHLDLSNIKVAEKKAAPAPNSPEAASKAPKAAPKLEKVLVELPISLETVAQLQRRLQDSADVSVSTATFISKATAFANSRLPVVPRPPTTNELFDEVLGLGKAKAAKFSQGAYIPSIPDLSFAVSRRTSAPKSDIIDILAGSVKKPGSPSAQRPAPRLVARLAGDGIHTFSLLVPKEEKARAELFLERCKLALEEVPETLI
ncbi:pyruvate dehydrogenase complex x precursor, dihydrolipoamide acetyltransferase comp [Trichoderma arundinaceum]|uniref:Pyruvate dehydrogenase complex x, dihydrolipoamide acetyltransferase comp n=1 Tax=Trichoderma arundinaceum TaxID=490622 RepID=A0A395NZ69_TRIAR|nr:pyruvate dehydrogenase complex x precursor, dihydrolipoamide acetyltransferase comp [Trichoderma arundinaceum]